MLQGALIFLKYFQCFILLTVLAVCLFPFQHFNLSPTVFQLLRVDRHQKRTFALYTSFLLIKDSEALQTWFTLHLHTFGTDEHNVKPVTNEFAMKQEEKQRAGTMNSSNKLILTWYTSTPLYSQLSQIRCRAQFLFRINSIITKYFIACMGKLPLQYMALI